MTIFAEEGNFSFGDGFSGKGKSSLRILGKGRFPILTFLSGNWIRTVLNRTGSTI